jgi:hypothetical protein
MKLFHFLDFSHFSFSILNVFFFYFFLVLFCTYWKIKIGGLLTRQNYYFCPPSSSWFNCTDRHALFAMRFKMIFVHYVSIAKNFEIIQSQFLFCFIFASLRLFSLLFPFHNFICNKCRLIFN